MDSKKLYLISGFLGSGKTTLLKNLIGLYSDRKIAVIVNEFGKQGVDGALLAETGIRVTEINNGSIFCVCRSDLFVDALQKAIASDAEMILVETSGLSDPTGMDQILKTLAEVSGRLLDFCGTVVVVESGRFMKLHENVVAIKQQIRSAGLVLINKMDISDPATVAEASTLIARLNLAAKIYKTSHGAVERAWMDALPNTQRQIGGGIVRHTLGVKSMLVKVDTPLPYGPFCGWLRQISGETYRMKGFVDLDTGRYLVDCVGAGISISETAEAGDSYVVILSGGGDRTAKLIAETYRQIFGIDIVLE